MTEPVDAASANDDPGMTKTMTGPVPEGAAADEPDMTASSSGATPGDGQPERIRAMVREATVGDWGDIWPIFRRVIAGGDTYCLPTEMMGGDARNLWFGGPQTTVLVAVDPRRKPRVINPDSPVVGAVVGTASIHPNRDGNGAHIANASFMVDPDYAGMGVGRVLAMSAMARARRDGYRGMQFNAVVETNHGAVKLWTSLGFEIVGTVPGAFLHPVHGPVGLHVMYRTL